MSKALGDDAVALAAHAGLTLDRWQQEDLRVILGETAAGKWSAFEAAEIVARQNGKGGILEARELAGLFLIPTDRMLIHSAHEAKTSKEAYLRIRALIEQTPDLAKRVDRFYNSNENIAIHLKNGKRLRFVTRTKGGGRGFSGDLIIMDEAYELDSEQIAALLPVLSARPNPQLIYASSAGMAHSQHLHSVRRRAVEYPEAETALAYMEYSPDVDAPGFDPSSPQAAADANPALDIRITMETIERERRAMTPEVFARERLSIFDPDRSEAGKVIPSDRWTARAHPGAVMAGAVVLGVAVSLDGVWSSVAAVGRCADGHLMGEVIETRPGTGWVPGFVAGVRSRNADVVEVALNDSGPAAELKVAFTAAGLEFETVRSGDYAASCQALMSAIVDEDREPEQRFCHLDDPRLNLAVASVQKRILSDGYAWKRGEADVSPLEAVTVAFGRLQLRPVDVSGPSVYESRGFLSL